MEGQVSKTCKIIKIFERNRFTLLFVTCGQTMLRSLKKEDTPHKNVSLKLAELIMENRSKLSISVLSGVTEFCSEAVCVRKHLRRCVS